MLAAELPDRAPTASRSSAWSPTRARHAGRRVGDAAVPSPSGDAAVIQVIPTSAPQSEETTTLVHNLRNDVIPAALRGTGIHGLRRRLHRVGVDVSDRLSSRGCRCSSARCSCLSFLLLLVVFRSLLVPLKAVIMNLLSIGAAYGVVVAVFQWGWFGEPHRHRTAPARSTPFIPMMMFAILFGLSMDYEVFLLSRIREEYDRTGDNALAVADGLAATARVITAAARDHGHACSAASCSATTHDQAVRPRTGDGDPHRRDHRAHGAGTGDDGAARRPQLVVPGWLDRLLPRLHVEAGPDIDVELARLAAEDEAEPQPA